MLNHTYRHDNLGQLSAADVRRELLATEAVFKATGVRMPFKGVRPPFGGTSTTSDAVIAELGYRSIGADIDVADLVVSGSIVRSLARHIERHIDRGERTQIRADLTGQRRQLEKIRDLVEDARPSKIDAAGRATLLAQVDRMIASIP